MAAPSLTFDVPPLLAQRYRVLSPLGNGSIAQVVRARDEQDGREVAIKILYPNLQTAPTVATRFRREAEIVQRIEHPNVIRILEVGESEGHLYLVMDLHEGGDLADWVARRGPMSPDALLTLAEQLCDALEAAHRAGVIHRDIKPQNMLLGPGASEGVVDLRLVDFGLARTADLAGLTTRTTVLGTPEYMAPEVIADGYADPRSDLYSMGVVLFEAATGELPFHGDTPYALMRQHLTAAPPRVRERAATLPEVWDAVVGRLMAKDPLERFARAADVRAALAAEPGQALAPVSAEPVVAAAPASVDHGVCHECGAELLRGVSCCIECGAELLRLRAMDRGYAVLVTGPGEVADKIDSRAHVEIVKLLRELPEGSVDLGSLKKQAPRLPFFLLGNLEERSAQRLCERVVALGLEASVLRRHGLRHKGVRSKTLKMAARYIVIGLSTGAAGFQWIFREPLLGITLVPLVLTAPVIAAALKYRRPIAHLVSPSSPDEAALRRVADALPGLGRRQDRRLAARVLTRARTAAALGGAELAGLLAQRSAEVVEALAALERRVDAEQITATSQPAQTDAPTSAEALGRLRDVEGIRSLLVADLLRCWSRLDVVCLQLARAEALGAEGRLAMLVTPEIEALRNAVEAEEEVNALVGQGLPALAPSEGTGS